MQDSLQIVFGPGPDACFSLAELLPHRFGPRDLDNFGPFVLEDQFMSLTLTSRAIETAKNRKEDLVFQNAVGVALNEAQTASLHILHIWKTLQNEFSG